MRYLQPKCLRCLACNFFLMYIETVSSSRNSALWASSVLPGGRQELRYKRGGSMLQATMRFRGPSVAGLSCTSKMANPSRIFVFSAPCVLSVDDLFSGCLAPVCVSARRQRATVGRDCVMQATTGYLEPKWLRPVRCHVLIMLNKV